MSRVVRPFGGLCQARGFHRSAITAGLLSLSLASLGIVGCSSDEPTPAANQAQGNAAPAGAPPAAGAMQPPAGMMAPGGPPAGMAMSNPNGVPNAGAAPVAPGGAAMLGAKAPQPTSAGSSPAFPDAAAYAANSTSGAVPPMPPDGVATSAGGATPLVAPVTATPAGMPPGGVGNAPGAALTPPTAPPGAAGFNAANPRPGAVGAPAPPAGAVPGGGFGAAQPGQGGVPQSPQSSPGTAEFSAESIVVQLLNGEASGLVDFISPKCKGVLGDIRDGKATVKQIEDLKKQLTGLKGVGAKTDNGAKLLTLRNADNSTITFRVKKEGDEFKVTEMTIKAGIAKKGR